MSQFDLNEFNRLKKENKRLEYENKRMHSFMDKRNYIQNCMLLFLAFKKSIDSFMFSKKKIKSNAELHGSALRNIFELSLSLDIEKIDYPSDIDIILNTDTPEEIKIYNIWFNRLIKNLQNTDTRKKNIIINGNKFIIDSVKNVTLLEIKNSDPPGKKNLLNIYHYVINFIGPQKKTYKLDILFNYPNENIFSLPPIKVNNLSLYSDGLWLKNNTYDLFDIIHNIMHHQTDLYDFKTQEQTAFESFGNDKLMILKQLTFWYSFRITKILCSNYKIIGETPMIRLGKNFDCSISGIEKQNFPEIKIDCDCNFKSGKFISLMAYAGIISSKSDFTESKKCPYCRKDLKVKFMVNENKHVLPEILNIDDNKDNTKKNKTIIPAGWSIESYNIMLDILSEKIESNERQENLGS
jgi:hypothetical protein